MNPVVYTRYYFHKSQNTYYTYRCQCSENIDELPERPLRTPRPIFQEVNEKVKFKTFQIKYEKNLSSTAKLLLNSFNYKYLYYAIDDILDLLKSDPIEQENLLSILYSPVLSLQNDFCINFFDIWISEIYITKSKKRNKFLLASHQNFESGNDITIKFLYQLRTPVKKPESLW